MNKTLFPWLKTPQSIVVATVAGFSFVADLAAQPLDPVAPPSPAADTRPGPTEPEVVPARDEAVEEPAAGPTLITPPVVTSVSEPTATFGYKKGFFIDDGGVNKLVIAGRVQSRFVFESVDQGADRGTESNFSIPRARLTLKGNAYTKRLSYKFQSDFGKGAVSLKDFFVDYRLGHGEVRVRVGQFKKPFARQQLTSSSKLEFVDRSIVDKAFGNGRDIGLEIHNNISKSPDFEWALGVFNGTGEKGRFQGDVVVDPMTGEGTVSGGKFSNVPEKVRPAVVARAGINQGIKGYSEADLEGGPLRYSVAGAGMMHFSGGDNGATVRVGGDFVVKSNGLSATGGVYVAEDGVKESDLGYSMLGGYAQVGYIVAKTWQPAVRYALVAKDGGDKTHEVAAAISLYEFGHGLKLQSDVAALLSDLGASTTTDIRARAQMQLSF